VVVDKNSEAIIPGQDELDRPIRAVPLRRPGRTVAAAIVIVLLAMIIVQTVLNPAYQWGTFATYLFDQRIAQAAVVTLELTIVAMAIAIVLGTLLAVMRMSDNPVLKWVAWLFLWIFRGTPVYVQLVFWGLLTTIYRNVEIGVPFGPQWFAIDTSTWLNPFVAAILGLGLNQAAYTAEIVRAGILSVDAGQTEAASALGFGWWQTTTRIVLPQAMRFVVPPLGNELIGLLKTTSLVVAIPLTTDIYAVARQIGGVLYQPIPLLLVASAWYLAITSLMMIGQHFVERRFSRGSARKNTTRKFRSAAMLVGAPQPEQSAA
jgi:polar amino acid transport system permease protein